MMLDPDCQAAAGSSGTATVLQSVLLVQWLDAYWFCRKRKRITKRKDGEDSGSDFSLSDEAAAQPASDEAASDDTGSFQTDSELSDDPLGEYDDADDDLYEQRRHKYSRGGCCMCEIIAGAGPLLCDCPFEMLLWAIAIRFYTD